MVVAVVGTIRIGGTRHYLRLRPVTGSSSSSSTCSYLHASRRHFSSENEHQPSSRSAPGNPVQGSDTSKNNGTERRMKSSHQRISAQVDEVLADTESKAFVEEVMDYRT